MLNYSDKGSGSPLVLLHAFPLSRSMWDVQMNGWSGRYRTIAPDFPGFGDSPLSREEARIESFADEIRDLLRSLKIQEKIVLLGLSMGGYVAFEFARKYPERLRALILVATQPINDSQEARQARYEMADLVRKQGVQVLVDRMTPRLLGETTRENTPELIQQVSNLITQNSAEGVAKACFALASRRDSTPLLASIEVPVLIVAGAEDPIVPAAQLEVMKKGIRNSRLVIVEKCGHLVNLEQPQEFDRAVLEFLSAQ